MDKGKPLVHSRLDITRLLRDLLCSVSLSVMTKTAQVDLKKMDECKALPAISSS